jgi:hypothetical protein
MIRAAPIYLHYGDCLKVSESVSDSNSSMSMCGYYYNYYGISTVFNSSVTVDFTTDAAASTVNSGFQMEYVYFKDSGQCHVLSAFCLLFTSGFVSLADCL